MVRLDVEQQEGALVTKNGSDKEFKVILHVETAADGQLQWKSPLDPAALNLLLDTLKAEIVSGRFQRKEESPIVTPDAPRIVG